MEKAIAVAKEFFEKESNKLTIVNRNRRGVIVDVTFNAPEVDGNQGLSILMRKEPTDSFLLTGIRNHEGTFNAYVLPKKAFRLIHQHATYVGNQLERIMIEGEPFFIDTEESNSFAKAISEMYEIAATAEALLYSNIAPNIDLVMALNEYSEATSEIMEFHKHLFTDATHKSYAELIDTIDQIEI